MARWEVIATLGAFMVLWLLFRTIADPWAKEGRERGKPLFKKTPAAKAPPQLPEQNEEEEEDFPD